MASPGERDLVRRLAQAISPETAVQQCAGQQAIDDDDDLIDQVAALPPGSSRLRIWENQNCLVTTRPIARRKAFPEAAEFSARSGWPVHVRSSGGSTVIHRPGILNISLAVAAGAKPVPPDASYDALITLLQAGFRKLHIEPFVGSIAGAYCDGNYNLCLNNRKIAGTASRIIRRNDQTAYICHASITVYGSADSDIAHIRNFEQRLGLPDVYTTSSHATLADMLAINPG
ncbi:lipoate--protein ligase family protein [Parasphingorhabdus sp.]|uniref:lipoate--protein ligase family protein n=1 Tax=Parasphingorhabdus sp. TaxID=2709688 RepID=UPI003A8D1881